MTIGSCKVFAFRGGDGIRQEAFADARAARESKASKRRRNRQHDWRVWPAAAALAMFALILFAGHASGQTPQTVQPPSDLKRLSLDELQEIDVTSVSKRPEKLSETASAIQVITADDIRRSGATSLPEALRLASNLQVAQVDSRSWAISARGFNNTSANKLLVLIDGRVVYTPLHAAVFWDVQDTLLEDIDRIEVISGPGATLWGANAVNGVINVITKTATGTQGLLVTGGGGSELHGVGGIRYGGTLGAGIKVRTYGKYFGRDNSALPNGARATDDWNMGQGGFRLDWKASRRTTCRSRFAWCPAIPSCSSNAIATGSTTTPTSSSTMPWTAPAECSASSTISSNSRG